ncbi:MAG: glycosyltransferase family 25 protein [Alphaproteobacteria bacterium]|nr:glycosyltransferase family 25 protein [Alphaproteobacteria bacterium]
MWPSVVINLAANTARWANSARQLGEQGIPFDRLDAVHGWALPDDEIARVYDAGANQRRAKAALVRAEIGCYLSHIVAWRRIATGDSAGGFIFEDDFLASDDLAGVLGALSADPSGWDMVKLFSFDQAPRTLARHALGPKHEVVVPYRVPTCLIGYGITRGAAQHLTARAIPFFRPVDEDQKFFWETGLKVALVLPSPVKVGDQQAATATIGTDRRAAARRGPTQVLRSLSYQLRYNAALHWHRLRDRP